MATQTEALNYALTILGEERVVSIDDDVKAAREAKALWDIARDGIMACHTWSFTKTRSQLPSLTDVPVFGFQRKFQIPVECLRIIRINDFYVGIDLTDYRTGPTEDFTIEGREILTNFSDPLNVVYAQRVTNVGLWAAYFVPAFASRLAQLLVEPLTQSNSKRELAEKAENKAVMDAVRANAIELPPQKFADDEWLMSRL